MTSPDDSSAPGSSGKVKARRLPAVHSPMIVAGNQGARPSRVVIAIQASQWLTGRSMQKVSTQRLPRGPNPAGSMLCASMTSCYDPTGSAPVVMRARLCSESVPGSRYP
jgi:hypothetical protein